MSVVVAVVPVEDRGALALLAVFSLDVSAFIVEGKLVVVGELLGGLSVEAECLEKCDSTK